MKRSIDKAVLWWNARNAHAHWMHYEAASVGYDFRNASAARDTYMECARKYEDKYGVFNPYSRPKDVGEFDKKIQYKLMQEASL